MCLYQKIRFRMFTDDLYVDWERVQRGWFTLQHYHYEYGIRRNKQIQAW